MENNVLTAPKKYMPTSDRYSIVRDSDESLKISKQMTAHKAGAPVNKMKGYYTFIRIIVRIIVKRLQISIAKMIIQIQNLLLEMDKMYLEYSKRRSFE